MADFLVNPLGATTDITVPANSAISVWSLGAFDVYLVAAGVNQPAVTTLLASRGAGSDMFTSAVFSSSVSTTVRVQATGQNDTWYSVGTNPIIRSGGRLDSGGIGYSTAAQAINTSATATVAQILSGYISSTTAAAVNVTSPTGALLDAATTFAIGDSFEIVLFNSGGTNALAVLGSTGITLVGTASITSGTMRVRYVKTAASTFVVYRA